jgi:putative oxidoreductase
MNNASIARVGTILYGLVIGFFGINHFLNASGMAGLLPSFFHGAVFWVYLSGAALLLAAISIIIGKQTKIAGLLLAAFLLIIVLLIHLPAVMNAPDEAASRFPMTNLIKDTGLAAAALIIAGRGNGN